MRKVTPKYAVLQMIEALGFCRFIFKKYNCDLERGIILVVEDTWQVGEISDALCETSDTVRIKNIKNPPPIMNFQIGIYLYGKSDKEEWASEFLLQKEFLPVIIVAGIVPEGLYDSGYIFRLNLTGNDVFEFDNMYQRMVTNILENLEIFLYDMKNLDSSCIAKQYQKVQQYRVVRAILATGLVWKMVIREKNDEISTDAWMEEYCNFLIEQLRYMDDFTGVYAVQEAVRRCIFASIEENKLQILSLDEYDETERVIYVDENFYYFTEALLKKMCRPLTNTISFLQLKSEMYTDGILECNHGSKQNYTVKVTCFVADNKSVRKRFIKLRKECLLSDSGMSLEDWTELKNNEEVNENVDKDWRN